MDIIQQGLKMIRKKIKSCSYFLEYKEDSGFFYKIDNGSFFGPFQNSIAKNLDTQAFCKFETDLFVCYVKLESIVYISELYNNIVSSTNEDYSLLIKYGRDETCFIGLNISKKNKDNKMNSIFPFVNNPDFIPTFSSYDKKLTFVNYSFIHKIVDDINSLYCKILFKVSKKQSNNVEELIVESQFRDKFKTNSIMREL